MADLAQLRSDAESAIREAGTTQELEELRVRYLGRKSELTATLRSIRELPPEERGPVGKAANEVRVSLEELLASHQRSDSPLALVTALAPNPTGYGRIVRAKGKVHRVVEHKDATPEERANHEINAGVYAVDAAFLWKALDAVRPNNAQRELYLTDLVEQAAQTATVPTLTVPFEETAGVNDRVEQAAHLAVQLIVVRAPVDRVDGGVAAPEPAVTHLQVRGRHERDPEVLGDPVVLPVGGVARAVGEHDHLAGAEHPPQ